jgi:hypothetical protein
VGIISYNYYTIPPYGILSIFYSSLFDAGLLTAIIEKAAAMDEKIKSQTAAFI